MDIPELISPQEYDSNRAKFVASIRWIVTKSLGGKLPENLVSCFEYNNDEEFELPVTITKSLTSGETYVKACAILFPDVKMSTTKGHRGVIEVVSRFGVYVTDGEDEEVSEQALGSDQLCQKSHVALIDAIMEAYAMLTLSIDKVVAAVRRFSTFSASSELPSTLESCVVFWVNKACSAALLRGGGGVEERALPPTLNELTDVTDGRCLATLLSFYRPDQLNIADISLSDDLGIADSLHNLQLVYHFLHQCLHESVTLLHLTVIDLFYCPLSLHHNLLALFADLFRLLELSESAGVSHKDRNDSAGVSHQDRNDSSNMNHGDRNDSSNVCHQDKNDSSGVSSQNKYDSADLSKQCKDGSSGVSHKDANDSSSVIHPDRNESSVMGRQDRIDSSRTSHQSKSDSVMTNLVRVSDVTKKSFQPSASLSSSGPLCKMSASPRQPTRSPLLPKRQSEDNKERFPTAPIQAWMSDEAEINPDGTTASISGSKISAAANKNSSVEPLEPLVPAVLKPAKEKLSQPISKSSESGEGRMEMEKKGKGGCPSREMDLNLNVVERPDINNSSDSTPSEGYQTPRVDSALGHVLDDKTSHQNFDFDKTSLDNSDKAESKETLISSWMAQLGSKAKQMVTGKSNKGEELETAVQEKLKSLSNAQSSDKEPIRTSFAQIRATAEDTGGKTQNVIKPDVEKTQPGSKTEHDIDKAAVKKTTFAEIPGRKTTWAETTKKSKQAEASKESSGDSNKSENIPTLLPSELRLRMDEKRRQINAERRLAQYRQTESRDRVGQQAFKQVISKNRQPVEVKEADRLTDIDEETSSCDSSSQVSEFSTVRQRVSVVPIQGGGRGGGKDVVTKSTNGGKGGGSRAEVGVVTKSIAEAPQVAKTERIVDQNVKSTDSSIVKESNVRTESRKENSDESDEPWKAVSQSTNENIYRKQNGGEVDGKNKQEQNKEGSADDVTSLERSVEMREPVTRENRTAEYGASLDKLNTSLSELQDKIVRLSVQQDQIKNLVQGEITSGVPVGSKSPSTPASPGHTASATSLNSAPFFRPPIPQSSPQSFPGYHMMTGGVPGITSGAGIYQPAFSSAPISHPGVYVPYAASGTIAPTYHAAAYGGAMIPGQHGAVGSIAPAYQGHFPPPRFIQGVQGPEQLFHAGVAQQGGYIYPDATRVARQSLMGAGGLYQPDVTPVTPPTAAFQSHLGGASGLGAMFRPSPHQSYTVTPGDTGINMAAGDLSQWLPNTFQSQHDGSFILNPGSSSNTLVSSQQNDSFFINPSQTAVPLNHDDTKHGEDLESLDRNLKSRLPSTSEISSRPHSVAKSYTVSDTGYLGEDDFSSDVTASSEDVRAAEKQNKNSSNAGSKSDRLLSTTSREADSESVSTVDTDSYAESSAAGEADTESIKNKSESDTGFFVSFGSDSQNFAQGRVPPRRVPSKRRESSKNKDTPRKDGGGNSRGAAKNVDSTDSDNLSSDLSLRKESMNEKTEHKPGLLLVIGEDPNDPNIVDEMEKRKQKLCELAIKRKEQMEYHRMQIELQQSRAREALRQKQEESDRKRNNEKARREAIFQTYLQKKADQDEDEGRASAYPPPVLRRHKGPRGAARPKSQPPTSWGDKEGSPQYLKGSRDDVRGPAGGKGPTVDIAARSVERLNSVPLRSEREGGVTREGGLVFGGLTHRRAPTPVHSASGSVSSGDVKGADGYSATENYTGPKLYVKPSQKSNRNLIMNAISHCCLAGAVNNDIKIKVLEEIQNCDSNHFLLLFRDGRLQYRALYSYNPDNDEVVKIHGHGPKRISNDDTEKYFKYNSGAKSFSEVTSTKHITATIDAVTIHSILWQKTKNTPSSIK